MLDETKGTAQDTSSGETGQSSGGKSGTTSKDKGKLYTAADIAKVISDAKSEAGRLQKAAEQERDGLKQDLQRASSRLDNLEREATESRLTEARGDPDQLRAFQREQATTQRERALEDKERDVARREEQVKSDRDGVNKDMGFVSIATLAAKHGLATEELESLGISDHETLDKVAEKLAAAKPKAKTGEGEEGEEDLGLGPKEPDSGETTGGVGAEALTVESVEQSSMPALAKALEKAEK